uniref:Uncharacterized protein n=1 Tax=Meloidogyne enterolobii TaxID=390850 RepID=A0A6V7W9D3_MELEN|nr:unnamed protein product [Meloidogyne enterolobii]
MFFNYFLLLNIFIFVNSTITNINFPSPKFPSIPYKGQQFENKKLFFPLNQNKNNFSFGGIEINKICF